MRTLLVLSIAFASMTTAFSEDKATSNANDAKAVNAVCPMDGKPVDPKIAPVAGKTKEGKGGHDGML